MLFRLTTDVPGAPLYVEASSLADAAMVWWRVSGQCSAPRAKDLHIEEVSNLNVVRQP